MAESSLPDAFFDLNPYLEWALPSEHARRAKRASTSMSEIRAFYDAMLERMEAVLSFLEKYPADDPPADVELLFLLATALAEIAPAVEMYGEQTADGMDVLRLKPVDIYPQRLSREL
jgi:hypothetical protein